MCCASWEGGTEAHTEKKCTARFFDKDHNFSKGEIIYNRSLKTEGIMTWPWMSKDDCNKREGRVIFQVEQMEWLWL